MIFQMEYGQVEIDKKAIISTIASILLETYGIVKMEPADASAFLKRLLKPDNDIEQGIKLIEMDDERQSMKIELYVEMEYGSKLKEVAKNVIHSVSYKLKELLGIHVERIDVYVVGLRMD
ncbi:MAG: Asp23/Gls24 family envelope stress response protein [Thermotogae bacterium]|nr:Asp23/Gls24 family envelope stress response protein [Thermotogota bacterium]